MSITAEHPLLTLIDLCAVLPHDQDPNVRRHIQIALWYAQHPGLPPAKFDGLRYIAATGDAERDHAEIDRIAAIIGVEAEVRNGWYTTSCEIVDGIVYAAFADVPAEPKDRPRALAMVAA